MLEIRIGQSERQHHGFTTCARKTLHHGRACATSDDVFLERHQHGVLLRHVEEQLFV